MDFNEKKSIKRLERLTILFYYDYSYKMRHFKSSNAPK